MNDYYVFDDDYKLVWTQAEVKKVIDLWHQGKNLLEIATLLKAKTVEVAILILDLGEKGKIKPKWEVA